MALQHLRSSTANKRPTPGAMSDGQLALNTNLVSPGLFFKDSNGDSVKIGPVHVGTTAPNVSPGAGGQAGNSLGEAWLDTSAANPILKVFNGSAFVAVQPVGTGTVVSTTDTGTVTSTMILDGTILNADINASAAIVDTKLATIATAGKVSGTAITSGNISTSGSFTSTSTVTGTNLIPTGSGVPTNGIYLPAANSVAVATNGTGRLFVNSTGLVGIGTSSPGGRLVVADPGTAVPTTGYGTGLMVARADGLIGLAIGDIGSGNASYLQAKNFTNTDTKPIALNPSGGNVGIGTTPAQILHIAAATPVVRLSDTDGGYVDIDASDANLDLRADQGNTQTSSRIGFFVDGGEKARIDTSGRLLVGTSTARSNINILNQTDLTPSVQFEGQSTSNRNTGLSIINYSASDFGSAFTLGASNSNTLGTNTLVESGADVGVINFVGADGTRFVSCASIESYVDGTPGANDMPGRLVFSTTADGASSPTERMRIDSSGRVGIGTSAPTSTLHIQHAAQTAEYWEGKGLLIHEDATANQGIALYSRGGTEQYIASLADDATSYLIIGTRKSSSVNGVDAITIRGDGKVGIGTTSPAYQLELTQDISARNYYFGNTGAVFRTQDNTNGLFVGGAGLNYTTFTTNGTERMRINSSGNLMVGTTNDQFNSIGAPAALTAFNNGSRFGANFGASTTGSQYAVVFSNPNGQIGGVNLDGTSTSYVTSSDYRLKENVVAVADGIARLQQLKPSRFNFIADPDKTVDGFLAHEVQSVVPEAINGVKDEVDADGNPVYQGIDQSKLVPLLTAALQEAIGRIETLEGMVAVNNITIDEQQHQLSTLAARLTALESA